MPGGTPGAECGEMPLGDSRMIPFKIQAFFREFEFLDQYTLMMEHVLDVSVKLVDERFLNHIPGRDEKVILFLGDEEQGKVESKRPTPLPAGYHPWYFWRKVFWTGQIAIGGETIWDALLRVGPGNVDRILVMEKKYKVRENAFVHPFEFIGYEVIVRRPKKKLKMDAWIDHLIDEQRPRED